MLNLTYLKTFLSVADTKSFTKTAHKLALTQPGVSQHVKALEEFYNTVLLVRGRKSIELTPSGENLLKYGLNLFRELDTFKTNILGDNPHQGLCRFASPGSFGMKMYSFLLELQKKFPELIIHYEYRPNIQTIKDVLENKLDTGFISQTPTDNDLDFESIDNEKLCLIVPSNFEWNTFDDFTKLGFINHPDGFHHASRLLLANFPKQFKSMDEMPIKGFINQITRIPEPVALGMGFTALPEYAAKAFHDQKKIKILHLKKQIIDPIYCIWKRNRELPKRFEFIKHEMKASKFFK